MLLAHFPDDLLSPLDYVIDEYLTSVLRTPHHLILAGEK